MTLDEVIAVEYRFRQKHKFGLKSFVAGWNAAATGVRRKYCPYDDSRSGSAAYAIQWRKGYDAYNRNNKP